MGPKKKINKKSKKEEEPEQILKRDWVTPSQISNYLYCSICQDVFMDPVKT